MARRMSERYTKREETHRLTFGKYFPFTGLAPRTIGQDLVKIVEQCLHLTAPLSFGHLVADAKLRSPTVTPATRSQRVCVIHALETSDTAVLHRMVMCAWYIYVGQYMQ
jgi:hypothetical protein